MIIVISIPMDETITTKIKEWYSIEKELGPLEKQKKELDKLIRLKKKQKTSIEPQLIEFLENKKKPAFDLGNAGKLAPIYTAKKKGYSKKYLLAEVENYLKQLKISDSENAAAALVQHLKDNRVEVVKKSLVLSIEADVVEATAN